MARLDMTSKRDHNRLSPSILKQRYFAVCAAITYKDRWPAAVGELLTCSRDSQTRASGTLLPWSRKEWHWPPTVLNKGLSVNVDGFLTPYALRLWVVEGRKFKVKDYQQHFHVHCLHAWHIICMLGVHLENVFKVQTRVVNSFLYSSTNVTSGHYSAAWMHVLLRKCIMCSVLNSLCVPPLRSLLQTIGWSIVAIDLLITVSLAG